MQSSSAPSLTVASVRKHLINTSMTGPTKMEPYRRRKYRIYGKTVVHLYYLYLYKMDTECS